MTVQNLTAEQLNAYGQQRADARYGLLSNQAQNQYQRELSDLAFKTNLEDFNIDWGRKRQGLPQGFNERGTLQSGLYHQALQDYGQDRLRGINQLAVQNQLGNNQYTMQGRGYEDQYANAMYGSYNSEYASKADLAAKLREIL